MILSNPLLLTPFLGGANVNAIEAHSDYTSASGTASASSEYSSLYAAWKAADGITVPASRWAAEVGVTSGWWKYHFTSAQRSGGYSILITTSTLTRAPYIWTFEGLKNDEDWTVLDSRSGETGWSQYEKRIYTFDNYEFYDYYRLNITHTNGALIDIGEIEILI